MIMNAVVLQERMLFPKEWYGDKKTRFYLVLFSIFPWSLISFSIILCTLAIAGAAFLVMTPVWFGIWLENWISTGSGDPDNDK